MQEPSTRAATRPVPAKRLALAIVFGVIFVGTWLARRSHEADAPPLEPQAPASQAASGAAPAVPALAASLPAASAASANAQESGKPALASAAQASAPQRPGNSIDTQTFAQFRSPADALRQVQQALSGGSPQQLLEAAQTLQGCQSQVNAVSELHALRDRPDDAPEPVKKMMRDLGGVSNEMLEVAQIEARRCQVFDSGLMARRKELFQRAYDGGAQGSAPAYLRMLQTPEEAGRADPAFIARLQADVRKAAAGGDVDSLLYLAAAPDKHVTEMGVTAAQRAGYRAAWKTIEDDTSEQGGAFFEKFMPPLAPLSASEQAEANALAQQVVETWRRKPKKDKGG